MKSILLWAVSRTRCPSDRSCRISTIQTQKERCHTLMRQVGFELTATALVLTNSLHALDGLGTVIDTLVIKVVKQISKEKKNIVFTVSNYIHPYIQWVSKDVPSFSAVLCYSQPRLLYYRTQTFRKLSLCPSSGHFICFCFHCSRVGIYNSIYGSWKIQWMEPLFYFTHSEIEGHEVEELLSHYDTSREVAESIPHEDITFFYLSNPSSRSMILGLTQPLKETSTRNLPGRESSRRVNLTFSRRKPHIFTATCDPTLENVATLMSHRSIILHGLSHEHI
jgi:hypothetical protein